MRLIPALLAKEHSISCWVRSREAAEKINSRFPQVAIVKSPTELGTQDLVLNLIVDYGRTGSSTEEIMKINVDLPFSLIEQTDAHGIINFSTALPENYSIYSNTKIILERKLAALTTSGVRVTNLKIHNFYGSKASDLNFVVHMIKSMSANIPNIPLTKSLHKRDIIHISDMVSAAMTVIDARDEIPQTSIDVGTGDGIILKDIVEFIKIELNSSSHLDFGSIANNPAELPEMKANIEILQSLGWKPKFSWKEGIRQTIKGMQSDSD